MSDSDNLVGSASSVTHGYQGPEGSQSHAKTYARSNTKEPSACQCLLSGSGQDTVGACFVQKSAVWVSGMYGGV